MIFAIYITFVAIAISFVSAWYSIAGLTAIFAGATVPVIIMGTVLEIGKITVTVWMHAYWKRIGWKFKMYGIPALIGLMLLTSMGVFGFLSKAHLEHGVPLGDVSAQVDIIDEKINYQREIIEQNKEINDELTSQISRYTELGSVSKGVKVRKGQAEERDQIQANISKAQQKISELQAEKAPLAVKVRKVEAEVGPLRYIAALIYGDNPDNDVLEKSVRWVIILIVLIFDPLAIMLILAGEQTMKWHLEDNAKRREEEEREAKASEPYVPKPDPKLSAAEEAVEWIDTSTDEEVNQALEDLDEPGLDKDYLKMQESIKESPPIIKAVKFDTDLTHEPIEEPEPEPIIVESTLAPPTGKIKKLPDANMPDPAPLRNKFEAGSYKDGVKPMPSSANDFGFWFPENPKKGDTYLRTNYIPSKLYKFNGNEWIQVDKLLTEEYTFNIEYIKHLISMIEKKHYDVELLTPSEQEQIEKYLSEQANK